jgi:HAD superfamily hydrolase (TIGR01509 family)
VRLTLELIGARDIFPDQCIITAADVEHGKPAPDMFLLAAQRMGVPPEACLVFEDGEMGFRAAAAAGMAYVKVPSRVD